MLVRQNPNVFQTVLDLFSTGYEAMNFEMEAEKITFEIFVKKSFVVKKRKDTETQAAKNLLQKLLTKKSNVKKSWNKKVIKKYSFETHKLSFGASPTVNIGNTSLISDLKLRIKIYEKDKDDNTILKFVFQQNLNERTRNVRV